MGYNTDQFLKSVDPNLICSICNGVLESPVLTSCGHSFCVQCLRTWLSSSKANSCPECRTWIEITTTRSILSLRNLIQALEVKCIHAARGCAVVTRLEKHQAHLSSCGFAPVTCVGCQTEVNTSELADHQLECASIRNMLQEDETEDTQTRSATNDIEVLSARRSHSPNQNKFYARISSPGQTMSPSNQWSHILKLETRISYLEKQVIQLLEDLKTSNSRNNELCLQYRRAQDELEIQQRVIRRRVVSENSHPFPYKFNQSEHKISTRQDIENLSLLIARHLLDKPKNVDSNGVFQAVRLCYEETFLQSQRKAMGLDIHMLLATAYACNWFTVRQKTAIGCWLQFMSHCQGCKRLADG